jgi:hypothetical protein
MPRFTQNGSAKLQGESGIDQNCTRLEKLDHEGHASQADQLPMEIATREDKAKISH